MIHYFNVIFNNNNNNNNHSNNSKRERKRGWGGGGGTLQKKKATVLQTQKHLTVPSANYISVKGIPSCEIKFHVPLLNLGKGNDLLWMCRVEITKTTGFTSKGWMADNIQRS